ncbi:MAG: hypothetical protein IKY98_03185, partial [Alphaproteobacteria bacterium]|nr:hypothetical protein [Alphaproteobacteria bacterium]
AILMISTVANACGGITIKSGKYCLSKHRMNWYSAYAWCQAQGMNLIEMEVCGSFSSCPALKLDSSEREYVNSLGITNYLWSNTSSSSTHVWQPTLSGGVYSSTYRDNANLHAICTSKSE